MATQPGAVAARARAALTGAIVVAAGSWGAAAGLLVYRLFASPRAAVGCAALAIMAVLWRGRYAGSMRRVALWVEEQAPALQYALVTAVDPQYSGTNDGARTAAVAAVNVGTMVGRAVIRTAGVPLLALAAATFVPAASYRRLTATVGDASNRLTPLTARVTPPTYARLPAHELSDPSTIPALVGSAVALQGRRGWRKDVTMPASPAAVRLVDRQFERLIVLDPIVDAPPTVVLTAPARDATIREPATGTLTLVAEGADDIGLR
ncbi:MAG TPA: hypothetical protein VNW46_17115, partial [Gemmatimonadaceae bacterium]|nr:hypothetical protein [Gemmatimonadaceae bacterium]